MAPIYSLKLIGLPKSRLAGSNLSAKTPLNDVSIWT